MMKYVTAWPARMKGHAPLVALMVLAIGTSIILMPDSRERAAREMKAGGTLEATKRLEHLVASGDRSTWTLMTLAQVREQAGDIKGAIEALELLSRERPESATILNMLAEMYKGAGLREQHLGSLQKLQALSGSAERQRLIARLLGELGRDQEQLEALQEVIDHFGGKRDDYLLLARLKASMGSPEDAAATLQSLADKVPEAVDARVISWEMSLWVAAGRVKHAIGRGRRWLDRTGRLKDAGVLAAAFTTRSLPLATVALLEPYGSKNAPPELIAALAGAEADTGAMASARRRIVQLEATHESSKNPGIQRMILELALRVNSTHRALATADAIGVETLPPDLLSNMASVALRAHRLDILSRIRREGGMFSLLNPVLQAQIHFALGEISTSHRLVEQLSELSIVDAGRLVELASLQLRIGRRDLALTSLRSITDTGAGGRSDPQVLPSVSGNPGSHNPERPPAWKPASAETERVSQALPPPALLQDIGRLYIRAGAPHEGQQVFERIRRWHPSPEAEHAWALTAIASSQLSKVQTWLSETETSLTPDMLQELTYAAINAQVYALASDLARLLVARRGNDADRLLLAEVRIAAGRPWVQVSASGQTAGARAP